MKHFIVSQNLVKTGMLLPEHTILRINLAWHKDLDSVGGMLSEYANNDIFMDIPVGRKKPPNHKHDLDDIAVIANRFDNVKYVAISNVESGNDIRYYCGKFKAKIVPKIETLKGTLHLSGILDAMSYHPKIIMLDHEDLFSNLVHLKKESEYLDIVDRLVKTCKDRKVHLLRVKGIIFSDE